MGVRARSGTHCTEEDEIHRVLNQIVLRSVENLVLYNTMGIVRVWGRGGGRERERERGGGRGKERERERELE